MRNLKLPAVDDADVLERLAISRGQKGRSLVGYMPGMGARYEDFVRAKGDPWIVLPVADFDGISDTLRELYDSPTDPLDFVGKLRTGTSGACPMCGGGSVGTLDHYLPKHSYSEFSFFSRNLVPCCGRCNNQRGVALKGAGSPERPIHPYFDRFAAKRIMTARFAPDWRAPKIEPVPFGVRGPVRDLVSWHIEKIVRPSGIIDHYIGLWSQLLQFHADFIGDNSDPNVIRAELARIERVYTRAGESPNSWDSCFWHGLQRNASAIRYLGLLM